MVGSLAKLLQHMVANLNLIGTLRQDSVIYLLCFAIGGLGVNRGGRFDIPRQIMSGVDSGEYRQ